ncbi:hypothetical protein BH10PLA2_BH10PLA2_17400 [soil metagenome]
MRKFIAIQLKSDAQAKELAQRLVETAENPGHRASNSNIESVLFSFACASGFNEKRWLGFSAISFGGAYQWPK